MSDGQRKPHALLAVLRGSAVPYGYTLTVLASHNVVASQHGGPDLTQILVFVVGAMLGFAALAAVAERRHLGQLTPAPGRSDLIHAGMIHVFAIGAAIGAAILASLIPGVAAWGLAAFASTVVYLTITSVEIEMAERLDDE